MIRAAVSTCTPTLDDLYREITRLEAALQDAEHDPLWDILTRNGVDRRLTETQPGYDVIYADLDYLHERNETLGSDEVDRRMQQALRLRAADLLLAGRWKRGDEVLFLAAAGTGTGAALRLLAALRAVDLSATCCVVPQAAHYVSAISTAHTCVTLAKRANLRGQVYLYGADQ